MSAEDIFVGTFFIFPSKKNVWELRSHKSLSDLGLDNVCRYFLGLKNVTELGMIMIAQGWSEPIAWGQRVWVLSFSSPGSQLASALLLQPTFRQDCCKEVSCLPQPFSSQLVWERSGIFPDFIWSCGYRQSPVALKEGFGVEEDVHRLTTQNNILKLLTQESQQIGYSRLGEVIRCPTRCRYGRCLAAVACKSALLFWQHLCLQSHEAGAGTWTVKRLCQVRPLVSDDHGRDRAGDRHTSAVLAIHLVSRLQNNAWK